MPVVNRIYIPQTGQLGPATLQTEGAWVELEVAIPIGLENYLRQKSLPIPKPTAGEALIDTGATFSAIDDTIMRALGVNPINAVQGGVLRTAPRSNTSIPPGSSLLVFAGHSNSRGLQVSTSQGQDTLRWLEGMCSH